MNSPKEMKLVFFMDAIEHVSRYIREYCSGLLYDIIINYDSSKSMTSVK